jgi:hypothetical protein
MEVRELEPAACGCKRFEMTGPSGVQQFSDHKDETCEATVKKVAAPKPSETVKRASSSRAKDS